MTSNLGSEYILDNEENAHELVMDALKNAFRPELINRIDEIIIFNSLPKEVIGDIVDKIIKEIENRLKNYHLKINLSEDAKNKIIEEAYNPNFGARPIKRYVTSHIENLLAHELINEDLKINTIFNIKVKNNEFIIERTSN